MCFSFYGNTSLSNQTLKCIVSIFERNYRWKKWSLSFFLSQDRRVSLNTKYEYVCFKMRFYYLYWGVLSKKIRHILIIYALRCFRGATAKLIINAVYVLYTNKNAFLCTDCVLQTFRSSLHYLYAIFFNPTNERNINYLLYRGLT